jgi:RNA polymerase sigma-70 factor (ECF subfamily)
LSGDSPAADPTGASSRDQAPSAHVLQRAIDGDDAAFAQLYVHLQPRLYRYAMSLVGQDADDVSADAWLDIARDLRGFAGDVDAFRGWAARIVRNRAMDHLRRGARRPAVPMAEIPDAAARENTEAAAMEAMSTHSAVSLIGSLPREQAEAVMLRAVVGLTARQAGLVLGKSPAAVRVSAHRGLKRLAAQLAELP